MQCLTPSSSSPADQCYVPDLLRNHHRPQRKRGSESSLGAYKGQYSVPHFRIDEDHFPSEPTHFPAMMKKVWTEICERRTLLLALTTGEFIGLWSAISNCRGHQRVRWQEGKHGVYTYKGQYSVPHFRIDEDHFPSEPTHFPAMMKKVWTEICERRTLLLALTTGEFIGLWSAIPNCRGHQS